MDALPYYKWYWIDYRANRKVQRMSWQARGLYRELLDEFWSEGSIPNDLATLADICGCPLQDFELLWPEIEPCFEVCNGVLINPKMEEQRTLKDRHRAINARNGKVGGISKLANASERLANASERLEFGSEISSENKLSIESVVYSERLANAKQTLSVRHIAEQSKSRAEQSRAANDPSLIARMVLMELSLSGTELSRNLTEVCESELAKLRPPDELGSALVMAWLRYNELAAQGKIEGKFLKSAAKFFGEGVWANESTWPWKAGLAPAPRRRGKTLAEQMEEQAISVTKPIAPPGFEIIHD